MAEELLDKLREVIESLHPPFLPPLPWVKPKEYSLTIGSNREEGYLGDVFQFYGYLRYNEEPCPGVQVTVYRDGVALGSATTREDGAWIVSWEADEEDTFEVYAEASP